MSQTYTSTTIGWNLGGTNSPVVSCLFAKQPSPGSIPAGTSFCRAAERGDATMSRAGARGRLQTCRRVALAAVRFGLGGEPFFRLRFGKLARTSVRAPRGNTVGQYRTSAHTALSLFPSRGEKQLHVSTEPSVRRVAELEATDRLSGFFGEWVNKSTILSFVGCRTAFPIFVGDRKAFDERRR